MKALRINKPHDFSIVDVDVPKPGAGEILVELEFAAICNQNDYKIFYGLYGDLVKYPCAPGVYGHEGVGTVCAVGPEVGQIAIGERVVLMMDGGPMLYQEYVLRKADCVVPIKAHVPAQDAAILELFGCAHHCLEIAGPLPHRTVALSGLGPAGLAILQLMLLDPPKHLVGIEIAEERCNAARALGLEHIIDPTDRRAFKMFADEGVDLVIDATGVNQGMLNAFEAANHEVVIFGFSNSPFMVDQSKWFMKELIIRNSKVQTIDNLRAVAKLLELDKIHTKEYVSQIMPFSEYDTAVEKVYNHEAIKILLTWK